MYQDPKTQELLRKWCNRLGMREEMLSDELSKLIRESKQEVIGQTDIFYEKRARTILGVQLASLLRAKAEPYVCYFIGVGNRRDINEREMERKRTLFLTDREKALMAGETDSKGTPLDTRKTLGDRPNPRFGRPLLSFYVKPAVALAKRWMTKEMKLMQLALKGEKSQLEVPLETPVLTRVNLKGETQYSWLCSSSTVTDFKSHEFPEIAGKTTIDVLKSAPAEIRPNILALEEWHENFKDDVNRLCIVEAEVLYRRTQVTSGGNYIIGLGDVEEDIEFPGITAFVPAAFEDKLHVGIGTRVVIVGTTRLGRDLLTGERTRVTLDVYGFYPIPELTMSEEKVFIPKPDEENKE